MFKFFFNETTINFLTAQGKEIQIKYFSKTPKKSIKLVVFVF